MTDEITQDEGSANCDELTVETSPPAEESPSLRRSSRTRKRKSLFEEEDHSERAVRVRQQGRNCMNIGTTLTLESERKALICNLKNYHKKETGVRKIPKGSQCEIHWTTKWRFVADQFSPRRQELADQVRKQELERVILPKQKDFYVVLVQGESKMKKSEHLYLITSELENTLEQPYQVSEFANDEFETSGTLTFSMPTMMEPGTYYLELGSEYLNVCCQSRPFDVAEAFGEVDLTKVGPWCICGCVRSYEETESLVCTRGSSIQWVACSVCHSWHHFKCYEIGNMTSTNNCPLSITEMRLVGHPPGTLPPADDEPFYCWWCFPYEEALDELCGNDFSTKIVNRVPTAFATRQLPLASMSLAEKRMWILGQLETARVERIKSMIKRSSGGYFRKKHDRDGNTISKRQYCTPDHVVCFLQKLVQTLQIGGARGLRDFASRNELDRDLPPPPPMKCLDLGAGTGALTNVLPPGSIAIEKEANRVANGEKFVKHCVWVTEDVMDKDVYSHLWNAYDLIVSNPDFEVALNFLVVAHHALRLDNPDARIIFLLPSDFFEASALRTRIFKVLPIAIELEFKLGHIDYLQHEEGTGAKRSVDSLFVFKRDTSRSEKFVHTLVNARLAGML